MSSQKEEAAKSKRHEQADDERCRQHNENRGDPEIPGKERDAVARGAEENRLAEAHDARVAPDQIEAQSQERKDEHTSDEDRQVILKNERQHRENRKQRELHDRDDRNPTWPGHAAISR